MTMTHKFQELAARIEAAQQVQPQNTTTPSTAAPQPISSGPTQLEILQQQEIAALKAQLALQKKDASDLETELTHSEDFATEADKDATQYEEQLMLLNSVLDKHNQLSMCQIVKATKGSSTLEFGTYNPNNSVLNDDAKKIIYEMDNNEEAPFQQKTFYHFLHQYCFNAFESSSKKTESKSDLEAAQVEGEDIPTIDISDIYEGSFTDLLGEIGANIATNFFNNH